MTKKKNTKKDGGSAAIEQLTVHVVLDRSGSMQLCKAETIAAYNAYVAELAKETPSAVLGLTQFDSQGIDTLPYEVIGGVRHLNNETFKPRGFTPLYDAIGKVVAMLDAQPGERKALVILTDGEENASREFNKTSIKKLLDERQAKGWLVIYLGANQDALAEGAKFGSQAANTMTFDTMSVGDTMAATARATTAYASAPTVAAGRMQASFTSGERARAVGKKPATGKGRRLVVDFWTMP